MNTAIIVAAGSGKRFGGDTPKQFLKIHGKPILIHTLERFEKCDSIDQIVLVLSENEIENFGNECSKYNIVKLAEFVAGGHTRAESVLNGLRSITAKPNDIIAVHDGARPLVSVSEISQTIEKAKVIGAACLVATVDDTIKETESGMISKTIDRSKLRRALTPQCFRYEILERAFTENDVSDIATDECFLVEQLSIEIAIVEGSSRNIKVTHEDDLKIVEAFLSNG